ncbi:hypothetical protein TrST_g6482 [Triparma strigata]|uniref:Calmodulin n=1 Tax=Triparma strigata TaxID=1606541 RepID=A0A9W7BI01_9STRA|nr:hypothetical protein TrST_g6482 [Triparma strigata]
MSTPSSSAPPSTLTPTSALTPSRQALKDNTKWSASRVFGLFDYDQNGTLDMTELAEALTATVGKRLDDALAKPYMEKYDVDNSGTLDLGEFEKLVKDVRQDMAKRASTTSRLGSALLENDSKKKKRQKQEEKAILAIREQALARALEFDFKELDTLLKPPTKLQRDSVISILEYIESSQEETLDLFTKQPPPPPSTDIVSRINSGLTFSLNDLKAIDIHIVCSSIFSFLVQTVSPLIHYSVTKMVLQLPRTINDYFTWVSHDTWDSDHKTFFFRVLEHWKWICEKEETIYFRRTMKTFYEENGLEEKIKDIEMNLLKFKDREVQMFEKLSKKYEKPNPCDKMNMPAGLLAKSVGHVMLRRNEETESGKVNERVMVDVMSFILDADVLSKLKFKFTSAEEELARVKVAEENRERERREKEAAGAANAKSTAAATEDEWTAARVFDLSDADKSGSLDIDELEFALTSVLGKIVTRGEVDKLMKKFDTDNSGGLDKAEFENFAAALKKSKSGIKSMFSIKSASSKKAEAAIVESQRQTLLLKEQQQGSSTTASSSASAGGGKLKSDMPEMSKLTEDNLAVLMKTVENNINEEGVYRVSGDSALVKALVSKVTSKPLTSQDVMDWEAGSVHVACSAIKKVLRDHAPLVPYNKYSTVVASKSVDAIKKAVAPASQFFDAFILHLAKVAANESKNKMSRLNIGTTVGVNCIRESEDDPTDMLKAGKAAREVAAAFALIIEGVKVPEVVPTLQAVPKRAVKSDVEEVPPAAIQSLDDGWDDEDEEEEEGTQVQEEVMQIDQVEDFVEPIPDVTVDHVEQDMDLADITAMSERVAEKSVVEEKVEGEKVEEKASTTTTAAQETVPKKTDLKVETNSSVPEHAPAEVASIRVSWKKGSSDEPLNPEEEVGEVFSAFGEVTRIGIKETDSSKKQNHALVVFADSAAPAKAIAGYKGPWKLKQMGGDKAGSSKSATPKSTKHQVMVEGMFERSIKISWNASKVNASDIPTSKAFEKIFSKYGDLDKVMMTEKEPYAVVLYTSSVGALNAARSYSNELGHGFKVKLLSTSSSSAASGSTNNIKSLVVSPKPKESTSSKGANESDWVDAGGQGQSGYASPAKSTTSAGAGAGSQQTLAPLRTPPSSSYDHTLMEANRMLETTVGGGSPVVDQYDRIEQRSTDMRHTAIIEKLMARVEYTEKALQRATDTVANLNTQIYTIQTKDHIEEMAKKDEQQGWAMESMDLKIKVKELENSEKEARANMLEARKESQVLQAELQSVERTAKTIEIVQQKAYDSAKREVGALLTMQENRLEAQGVEIGTLTQANQNLMKENENLVSQHNKACEELVAWRTRAEAAELELKSLGKYASSKEEQRSLEIARLLNSKVVGVNVGDLPMPISRSPQRLDGSPSTRGGGGGWAQQESKYSSPMHGSPVGGSYEDQRRALAETRIVSSQEILQQAWATQRELAERLDREIALAGNTLSRDSLAIEGLTGYKGARTWR